MSKSIAKERNEWNSLNENRPLQPVHINLTKTDKVINGVRFTLKHEELTKEGFEDFWKICFGEHGGPNKEQLFSALHRNGYKIVKK